MDTGLVVTFVGIVVAGLAGILGVWLERNRAAPPGWAYVFTALIVVATGLKVAHSVVQKAESAETSDAMERVLERLVVLSERGTNPALEQFVGIELAVQSRSNPKVIDRLEERVKAKGGDPAAIRRKATAARRVAAGLPAREKGTKLVDEAAKVGEEAAKVGDEAAKAVEEILTPDVPGVEPEPEGKEAKPGKAGKAGKNR